MPRYGVFTVSISFKRELRSGSVGSVVKVRYVRLVTMADGVVGIYMLGIVMMVLGR